MIYRNDLVSLPFEIEAANTAGTFYGGAKTTRAAFGTSNLEHPDESTTWPVGNKRILVHRAIIIRNDLVICSFQIIPSNGARGRPFHMPKSSTLIMQEIGD